MNDPIAMLRADIEPIARAGLAKATEIGEAVTAAKNSHRPKRRKWWLGPLLALVLGGIAFAVMRSRDHSTGGASADTAPNTRLGTADSAPEPITADAT